MQRATLWILAFAVVMLVAAAASAQPRGAIGQYIVGKSWHTDRSHGPHVQNSMAVEQVACLIVYDKEGDPDGGAYDNGPCSCVILDPLGGTDDDSELQDDDWNSHSGSCSGSCYTDFDAVGKALLEIISVPTKSSPQGGAGRFDKNGKAQLGVLATARKNSPFYAMKPAHFKAVHTTVNECLCDELKDLSLSKTLLKQAKVKC